MEYYSVKKKKKKKRMNNVICTNKNGPRDCLTK